MTVALPTAPTPPSSTNPANFSQRADAWNTYIFGLVTVLNQQNAENNTLSQGCTLKAQAAEVSANLASTKAAEASTSAAAAALSSTTASTKAAEASTSAAAASLSSTTASTKAAEASTSAAAASLSSTTASTKAAEAVNSSTTAAFAASSAQSRSLEAAASANLANDRASLAVTKASEASASALQALQASLFEGTSQTQTTWDKNMTLVTQTGKLFEPGMPIFLRSLYNVAYGFGLVKTYSSNTGSLEVVMRKIVGGAVTALSWVISAAPLEMGFTWQCQALTSLTTNRTTGFSIADCGNGKIVGVRGYPINQESVVFDIRTRTWKAAAQIPFSSVSGAIAMVPGGALLVGGDNHSAVYLFDGTSWTYKQSYPYPICVPGISLLGSGKVLVTGGQLSNDVGAVASPLSACYVSSLDYTTWTLLGYLPVALSGHKQATLPNGRQVLIVESSYSLSRCWLFDVITAQSEQVTSLPVAKYWGALVSLTNGSFMYIGGYTAIGVPSSEVLMFDLESKVWRHVANLPVAQGEVSAVCIDGVVYAFGASSNTGVLYLIAPIIS